MNTSKSRILMKREYYSKKNINENIGEKKNTGEGEYWFIENIIQRRILMRILVKKKMLVKENTDEMRKLMKEECWWNENTDEMRIMMKWECRWDTNTDEIRILMKWDCWWN